MRAGVCDHVGALVCVRVCVCVRARVHKHAVMCER